MERVIRFTTDKFDVSKERPNPINPIPGESLLIWLREQVGTKVVISESDAEDWGWYAYADWNGRQYMLGSCALEEEENGEREWILQVVKERSLKEKLLFRQKMLPDDECARFFQNILEGEPGFKGVSVD
jgi:hypothetical protein